MEQAAKAVEERRRELGNKIAQARKDKRWKQKQLAAAVHVEPVTVSRWERGQHTPDLEMLELIAKETGKPLGFFIADPPPAQQDGDGGAILEEVRRVFAEIRLLREGQDEIDKRLARLEAAQAPPAQPATPR